MNIVKCVFYFMLVSIFFNSSAYGQCCWNLIPPKWVLDAIELGDELIDFNTCLYTTVSRVEAGGLPAPCNDVEYIPKPPTILQNRITTIIESIKSEQVTKITIDPLETLSENDSAGNSAKMSSYIKLISFEIEKYQKSRLVEVELAKFTKTSEKGHKEMFQLKYAFEKNGGYFGNSPIIASNWSVLENTYLLLGEMSRTSENKLKQISENNQSSKLLLTQRINELMSAINNENNSVGQKITMENDRLTEQFETLQQQGRELRKLSDERDNVYLPLLKSKEKEKETISRTLDSLTAEIESLKAEKNGFERDNKKLTRKINDVERNFHCPFVRTHTARDESCSENKNEREEIRKLQSQINFNNGSIRTLNASIGLKQDAIYIKTEEKRLVASSLLEMNNRLNQIQSDYKVKLEESKKNLDKYWKDRKVLDNLRKLQARNYSQYAESIKFRIQLTR
jgi:hypothetical protein